MDLLTLLVLAEHRKVVRYVLPAYLDATNDMRYAHALCMSERILLMSNRHTAAAFVDSCEEYDGAVERKCRWCNQKLSLPADPFNSRNAHG